MTKRGVKLAKNNTNGRVTIAIIGQKLDDLKEYTKDEFKELSLSMKELSKVVSTHESDIKQLNSFKETHIVAHEKQKEKERYNTELSLKKIGIISTITGLVLGVIFFILDKIMLRR